jgi:hypothetical protein
MTICERCGKPVRYIASVTRGGPDIFVVDVEPKTLIHEKGRVISGYQEHICTPPDGGKAPSLRQKI